MRGIPAIVVHGGAGRAAPEEAREQQAAGLLEAIRRGWQALASGALAAAVEAVASLEDDPAFNAGHGSVLNSEGSVEMDASVMDGSRLACGAVAAVTGVRNPSRLALALLERGPHVFLVGAAARQRAAEWGIELCATEELITPRQLERWRAAKAESRGTVGAVAVDERGHVAAATSTGGMLGKWPGRVGDSAVIGAGTYADDRSGAASATGHGEAIIRVTLARAATAHLAAGVEPQRAAARAIAELAERTGAEGGIILADPFGRLGWAANTEQMAIAWRCGTSEATVGKTGRSA